MKSLILTLFLIITASAVPSSSQCRCRPHQSCWPSVQEWNTLNRSIQGNLIAVRPIGAVCHIGDLDNTACTEITVLGSNSTWRASQPGAVQWENWEAWPEHSESCYLETSPDIPCKQGRISLYSAVVKSAAQIQETVRFTRQYNLRLAIKNSGHDFLGRSSAPESLQILTNGMKDIQIIDNFIPTGAPRNKGEGPAVTLDAGVSLQELYAALSAKSRTVVGGASHTVGPAGGYIQGGGHSFLGTWKGMASDNALEFSVVTATGEIVIANDYQNRDLFWALRGGGGGTFGIVAKVTVRTFDEAPIVFTNLNVTTVAGDPAFWTAMTDFHAALPTLNDAGGAGYYYIIPNFPLTQDFGVSAFMGGLIFVNTTDTASIDQIYTPLLNKLNATANVTVQYTSFQLPSIAYLISDILIPGNGDTDAGAIALLGSRLFSRDLLNSPSGPSRLTSALQKLRYDPYESLIGHVVAGGTVASNAGEVDSALNPAWRKTIVHLVFSRSWNPNATVTEQNAIRANITNVEVPILQSVEGRDVMGAYLNEANVDEVDFQASFWGENYPRLYAIKQKWDPEGIFVARKSVGSEDWDEEGLCRVKC